MYGGKEPSKNRVVVPARQVTTAGWIDSLESIPGHLENLKIPKIEIASDRLCIF